MRQVTVRTLLYLNNLWEDYLSRYSLEIEIEQTENLVKINKFNIDNLNKKLEYLNVKVATIQRILKDSKSTSSYDLKNLRFAEDKLKLYVISQKGLITELERELKVAVDKLDCLKSNYSQGKY